MKSSNLFFILVAACMACCIASLLGLTGTSAAAVMALFACAIALTVLTVGSGEWSRRHRRLDTRVESRGPFVPRIVPGIAPTSLPAAPLASPTVDHRLERIRRLASKHLRSYTLTENALRLSYGRDAAVEIEDYVALERKCSACLEFRVDHRDSEIELVVVGTATPGPQARWLLMQFLALRMHLPINYDAPMAS
jgi:hypothetical protein